MSEAVMERRTAMAVLARATEAELSTALATASPGAPPVYTRLRGPEVGLVMAQGRAGGGGAAFNLGEVPVTRCAVRLETGTVGHAYLMGRDERRAELAAVLDGLMVADPGLAGRVLPPVQTRLAAERAMEAARAAATRVQFFTLGTMRS